MKKKWMIAAVVAGMTVTGSAGVYAGAKLEQIKAYLNHSIGIVVDGTPYGLKDGNGKALTPITYGGLTYLPIRSISDALDIPISYDATNYKVRIGTQPEGTGGSTGVPTSTKTRPVNLPTDFPIPGDATIKITADSDATGVKKVAFTYTTEETLDIMGFVYSEYVRIKHLDSGSQTVTANTVKISGLLGGTSPVSITGQATTGKPGFNTFTITWSES
ncbi:hypothetical protein [Paenibacillus wynnii]|uniref:hypothetical protein n=1 Tax=Paenibacillus wynnii TaxID=268407 RepID=UPI00068A2D88|nr:hypothetical protein [Paenibacillus wynnii]